MARRRLSPLLAQQQQGYHRLQADEQRAYPLFCLHNTTHSLMAALNQCGVHFSIICSLINSTTRLSSSTAHSH